MSPKPKKKYFVYKKHKDDRYEFLSATRAVSEAQAANNVRWTYYGETHECDLDFLLEAAEENSAKHSAICLLIRMKHEENRRSEQMELQLVF